MLNAIGTFWDWLIRVPTIPPAPQYTWINRSFCGMSAIVGLIFLIFQPFLSPIFRAAGLGSPIWDIAIGSRALFMGGIAIWGLWRQPWRVATRIEQRQGRVLATFSLILLGQLIITFVFDETVWRFLISLLAYIVSAAGCGMVFWLTKRGYTQLGTILLTGSLLAQVSLSISASSLALSLMTQVITILVGGLLYRWWAGPILAIIFPVLFLCIQATYLEPLPALRQPPIDGYSIYGYTVLLISIAVIAALYARSLELALHTSDIRTIELDAIHQQLAERNEILEQTATALRAAQTGLEQQVAERTIQLDEALQNAQKSQLIAEQAQVEANRANQLKSKFLANMSHELRSPLNAIINFTQFVADQDYGDLNETQLRFLERALANSNHLLGLINDILDMAKIEAGRMELYLEEIDLNALLREALGTAMGLTSDKNLEMTLDSPADLPQVWIDKNRIWQVLLNLLSNAVKFTHQGSITLRAYHTGEGFVTVAVKDTGLGIPVESQAAVFEEFQQVQNNEDQKYTGTGLGLPISKHFIELHGGRMWLESQIGLGSTFFFTIPLT